MAQSEAKKRAFLARATHDLGAAQGALLMALGDRLGLYRALASGEAMEAAELARRTRLDAAYVAEWLAHQAAAGYLEYDAGRRLFHLPPEHAAVLADEDGPTSMAGAFQLAAGLASSLSLVERGFRTGRGVSAAEYPPEVAAGLDRAAAARAAGPLIATSLAALEDDLRAALEAGGSVAEIGCGSGAVLRKVAQCYPRCHALGIDPDPGAVARARAAAERDGLGGRVRFERAEATELTGQWDLVVCIHALHEMPQPAAAAQRVRAALPPHGAWLLVEPAARDRLEDNLDPAGALLASLSTLYCLPSSRASGPGALGTLMGETRLLDLLRAAGFTRRRRLGDTALEVAVEGRP